MASYILSRYGSPRSVDDMLDMYEENPVYELRKRAGPDSEHFSRSKQYWINSRKNHHFIKHYGLVKIS